MTEAEWLACNSPPRMLEFLRGRAGDRKVRLFAVACCRHILHLLTDDRNRIVIEVAERYADGLVPKKNLKAARRRTFQARSERPCTIGQDFQWGLAFAEGATDVLTEGPHESAQDTAYYAAVALAYGETQGRERDERFEAVHNAERLIQARLLRDIFGNPFRPVSFDPAWRTANVVALARTVYEERELPSGHLDGTRLAILADALLDAGCDNADILDHCRSEGPHVRGCWVVDLLLGKV